MNSSLSLKQSLRQTVGAISTASNSVSQLLPPESSTWYSSVPFNHHPSQSIGAKSRASYRSRRSIVNTALELAKQHTGDSAHLTTIAGDVYCHISGTLGDTKYNAFCTDCTLVTINYCERALEQVAQISVQGLQDASGGSDVSAAQVQKIKEMRGLINHDYLVLELESGGAAKLHILAEKLTGRAQEVGIHIEALVDKSEVDYRLHEGVRLYAMQCRTKIGLSKIEEILKGATDAHYNLKDNNCWDYAFAATRRLLNECTACVGPESPEYNRLKQMHDNLEGDLNRKSIKATLKTACEYIRSSYIS
ncbi:uncharacterized protein [Physcomitrium patens]|uniref:Uncharacterized protein n=1 Tax=Physcomitrium patens TaxID=3218 RepID=A0A7I4B2A2_PHYPA|nr:uncharacterized protein LOC112293111 isoform X1 [Physcomitrium patens]|eukprot:XP_024397987.1 uncharacterized protein LOC112293111 isoform X1 [Physcomitrella patens]